MAGEDLRLSIEGSKIEERKGNEQVLDRWVNTPGLFVWHCDFSALHSLSLITEEEKERLRMYGAIFSDEDERRWKEAVADAYGDQEDDDEPQNPPHP